jgi:hypothetical protein
MCKVQMLDVSGYTSGAGADVRRIGLYVRSWCRWVRLWVMLTRMTKTSMNKIINFITCVSDNHLSIITICIIPKLYTPHALQEIFHPNIVIYLCLKAGGIDNGLL